HHRYWIEPSASSGDPARLGLTSAKHPLLGAAVESAHDGSVLFTGRLSLTTHPWLAEHVVLGTVMVPGTVFVDLASCAGSETGSPLIDELTLHTPLVLPDTDGVRLQVAVAAPDTTGFRKITIHSQPVDAPADASWAQHATGTLTHTHDTDPDPDTPDLTTWPPPGAVPLPVDDFYERLRRTGVDYGPAFQGLRAAWRRGDELFAELAPGPDHERDAERFAVHPALLDAAVQTQQVDADASDGVSVAFSWHGVRLSGAGPTRLRVRSAPVGEGARSVHVADESGRVVAVVASLAVRPISAEQLRAAGGGVHRDALFRLRWNPVRDADADADGGGARLVLLGTRALTGLDIADSVASPEALGAAAAAGEPLPDGAVLRAFEDGPAAGPGRPTGRTAAEVSARLAAWVGDARLGDARLVVVTRRSVAVDGHAAEPDPAQALVWGAVRVAQAAHPDRIVLVDVDDAPASAAVLPTLPLAGNPRLAVRDGRVFVPSLVRVAPSGRRRAGAAGDGAAGRGTVLVTGADRDLAAAVAGHLVAVHGVRRLVLACHGGRSADGTDRVRRLADRLADAGAHVDVASYAAGDRASLAAVLRAIDAAHPLVGVVHAAGPDQDDGPWPPGPGRLDHALETRAGTAWALHELTAGQDLAFFVTFSSAADVPAAAGRGATGVADAFVDALAVHRRARGLPAVSLAWGPTAVAASGGGGEVPAGLVELSASEALDLFDAALRLDAPVPVLARLDLAALRTRPGAALGPVRDLVREPDPRAAARPAGDPDDADAATYVRRLVTLPGEERERELLALVRAQAAAVLGFTGVEEVAPERAFKEVGFDSLTAVELRNRLVRGTGIRLRSTLVFDFPNPVSLTRHMLQQLADALSAATPVLADLDRLHSALPAVLSEDGAGDRIAQRLRALLALCDTTTGQAGPRGDADADDLQAATDDELFSLVDGGFE
ncbi:type I polyketide synthase, partial [Streptomyces sp. B1866]|uniref:type I polyketide synthase n=1 Tax=Streptomyces sp. B1866 TaxID=3075431 RepID=UPI0028916995